MKDLLDKAHLSLIKSKYSNDYKNDINNYNYMLISSELKLSDGSVVNIDSMAIKNKHTGEIIASGSPSLNPELNSTMSIDKIENIKDFLNNPLEEYEFLQEKYRYKKDEKDLDSLKLIDNSSSLLQEYSDIKNKYRNDISYFNFSDFINIKLNNNREFSIDKNENNEPLVTDVIDIKGMEFGNSNDYNSIVNISHLSVISNKNLTQNDLDSHFLRDELLASLQESILKNKNNSIILDNLHDFEYSLISGFSKFENPLNKESFDVGILSLALKETKTGKLKSIKDTFIQFNSQNEVKEKNENKHKM